MSANSPASGDRWLTDGNRIVRLREDGQRQPLLTLSLFATRDEATLIAEAGNVRAETGLTPRQLAEQRAQLLEALRHAFVYVREYPGRTRDAVIAAIANADAVNAPLPMPDPNDDSSPSP
jgi:hypothetical protein